MNGSRVWVTRSELPPRARRIHGDYLVEKPEYGTTSACAENTARLLRAFDRPRNYLRVRGEYEIMPATSGFEEELPPRARRIHTVDYLLRQIIGTTSACAENTARLLRAFDRPRNYLRVRGEYEIMPATSGFEEELPPRARRIHTVDYLLRQIIGTTSACAENTSEIGRWHLPYWNYLRVRGEYGTGHCDFAAAWELPPRARRIQARGILPWPFHGNYLRVRGEYFQTHSDPFKTSELPPRARRIRCGCGQPRGTVGTTSACAENT